MHLTQSHISKIKTYCNTKCKECSINNSRKTLQSNRGKFKGYKFGLKLCDYLLNSSGPMTSSELYHYIKKEKHSLIGYSNKQELNDGIIAALYDLEQFVLSV